MLPDRYKLKIQYDGSKYLGWQQQKKGRTVQGVLEESFNKFLNQEQKIRESAPVDKAKAEKLASEFGVTVRSVISKTISMKVPYIKEQKVQAQARVRKAEVVRQIESALGVECNSLVNATAKDLATLLDAIS